MTSLANELTIIQNFICTHPARLEMLLGQLPIMARIFGDVKFIVNYNTEINLPIIKDVYKKNIKNLDFNNDLQQDWGLTTLRLLDKCTTPRVLYLCEDFVYLEDIEKWNNTLSEVIKYDVDFLMLSKVKKYLDDVYTKSYEQGEHIYFYNSKNSPHATLSIDAVYKKDFLIERIKEYTNLHSYKIPNPYEVYYNYRYSIRTFDLSCAVPKEVIIEQIHPNDEKEANHEEMYSTRNSVIGEDAVLKQQIKLKNGVYFDINIKIGDCVIDCGANVGDVADYFQSFGANVIAFEPNSFAFEILQKRFINNNKVKCIQKGVSGKKSSGIKKLFLHERAKEDQVLWSVGSSIIEDKGNINAHEFIDIELIDLCAFLKFFKRKVKVLKIDIEGAEVELLNDLMDEDLIRNIPYIFVETHEEKVPSLREPIEKLKQRIKNENYSNINLNWI